MNSVEQMAGAIDEVQTKPDTTETILAKIADITTALTELTALVASKPEPETEPEPEPDPEPDPEPTEE